MLNYYLCIMDKKELDDKAEQLIKDIIQTNEYNVESYTLLLKKNHELQNEIYKLKYQLNEQNKLLEANNKIIKKVKYDVTENTKTKIADNYAICGHFGI